MANNDCSYIAIVQDQKNQLAYFHVPPARYTPISPYAQASPVTNDKTNGFALQQRLNMRRKVEILKYKSCQQSTQTNGLTQKEKWALLSRGNTRETTSHPRFMDCSKNFYAPTWSTAADVPGPPILLQYDDTVPLYNYINGSINNASYMSYANYAGSTLNNSASYYTFSQSDILFFNVGDEIYVSNDVSNVFSSNLFYKDQSLQVRTQSLGKLVITPNQPAGPHTFSFVIPIGVWVAGTVGQGVLDTSICPDDPNFTTDPSYSAHVDPIYGPLDYLNACYHKLPGVFQPSEGFVLHMLNVDEMKNLNKLPVTLDITYSGVPVTPLVTPTIYTSLTSATSANNHPARQDIQFVDVSFAPYYIQRGQFNGIQYVGNLIIDNLQLNVQPNQVMTMNISMSYAYDYPTSYKFDYFQSGIFLNLSAFNQNISNGISFASKPPPYIVHAVGNATTFANYDPDALTSATSPYVVGYHIGNIGANSVTITGIQGNYDTYNIYRVDTSGAEGVVLNQTEFTGLRGGSFTDVGLAPLITYTYSIMPVFNGMNGSLLTVGSAELQPVSIRAFLDISSVTTHSVVIRDITGHYTNYTLFRDVSSQSGTTQTTAFTQQTATIFTDTGLQSGVTYSYRIQGFIADLSSNTVPLGSVTTYNCFVDNAFYRLISNTSIILDITGTYTYVNIVRDGYPSKVYSLQYPTRDGSGANFIQFADIAINTSITTIPNGFLQGQPYTYSIQPILIENGIKYMGPVYALSTITIPTIPLSVTIGPISMGYNVAYFRLTNYKQFYYTRIARITDGVMGEYEPQPVGSVSFVDPSNAAPAKSVYFSANSVYAYSVIPYNNLDYPGSTFTSINVSPIATVDVQVASVTASEVTFNLEDISGINNFHYVSVYRNNVPRYKILTGTTTYTDAMLSSDSFANFVYSYAFIPYNVLNNPGIAYNSPKIAPLPYAVFDRYVDTSQNVLSFNLVNTNTFSYVIVQPYIVIRNYDICTNDVSGPYNQTTYMKVGYTLYEDYYNVNGNKHFFLPTDAYYFTITPYNTLGTTDPSAVVTTPPVSSPSLAAFYNYNNGNYFYADDVYGSVLINYGYSTDFNASDNIFGTKYYPSYRYVKIAEISGGTVEAYARQSEPSLSHVLLPSIDSQNFNTSSNFTLIYGNLLPYVAYQYNILPFNVLDQPGTLVTTPAFSPKSRLIPGVISNNDTDVSMSFGAASAFASLTVSRFISKLTDTSYVDVSYAAGTNVPFFVDPSTVFYANRAYAYSVVSYNAIGVSGDSWLTDPVSPRATVAIGPASMTTSHVTFSFQDLTAFYYVSVNYSVNLGAWSPANTTPVYSASGSLYFNPQTFTADSCYNFQLTPYNAVRAVNNSAIIQSNMVSPPATLTMSPLFISNYDLSLAFLNRTTYYYTDVARIDGGTMSSYTSVAYGTPGYQIGPLGGPDNALFFSDTSYGFAIVPYNAVFQASPVVTTPVTSPTPYVYIGPIRAINTDISFTFVNRAARSFYYLDIARQVNGVYVGSTLFPRSITEYHDPGPAFYADTSYQYTITPYNAVDVSNAASGQVITAISVTATVSITPVTIRTTDASFAFLGLATRPFYYVYVTRMAGGRTVDNTRISLVTQSQLPNQIYIDPSSAVFTADSSYQYVVTPYNAMDVSNPAGVVVTVPVSPFPVVSIGPISIITADVSFQFVNRTTYYRLDIARYIKGALSSYTNLPLGIVTYDDPTPTPGATTKFVADTSYVYYIRPYNAVGNIGTTLITAAVSPPAVVAFGAFATPDISFGIMRFSYQGVPGPDSYYYVSVARYVNGRLLDTVAQPPKSIVYTDTSSSFFADTSYAYFLTPFNAVKTANTDAGATAWTTVVSPPAVVTLSTLSVSGDAVSFSFTNLAKRQFYDVSLGRLVNGQLLGGPGTGAYTRVPTGTAVYTDPSAAFTADNSYQYVVTPYNVLKQPNLPATAYTNTDSPVATASFGTFTDVSFNKMRFTTVYGPNRYYNFSVRRNVNKAYIDAYDVKQPPAATSFTDPSSVFTADSSYAYYVVPYNAINFPNALSVFTTPSVSPPAVATLDAFTSVAFTNLSFTWLNPTSFYFMTVSRIVTSSRSASAFGPIKLPPKTTAYSDPSAPFYAYMTYTYALTPYNGMSSPGTTVQTATVSPPADVAFQTYSAIGTNQLKVQFVYSTSYEYLKVAEVSGGIVGSYDAFLVPGGPVTGDTSFVDTGLWPRIVYSYNAIPYNVLDASNGIRPTPNISPAAYITDTSFTAVSTTSISLIFNQTSNLSYYDVSVARITNGVYRSYTGVTHNTNTFTDVASTGTYFDASSAYQYSVLPFNAVGTAGTETKTAIVSPKAAITFNDASTTTTTSSITLNWSYANGISFRNISIDEWINGSYSTTYTMAVGAKSYTLNNRYAKDAFTYYFNPINALKDVGTVVTSVPISPIATLSPGEVTFGVTTPNFFTLQFSNTTTYKYVQIQRLVQVGDNYSVEATMYTTVPVSSYSDSGSFNANSYYKYTITPYNALGTPNLAATFTTDAINVSSSAVTFDTQKGYTVSLNSISFSYLDNTTFSYVRIAPKVNGTLYPSTGAITATSYTDTAYKPYYADNSYCYVITPYNNNNQFTPSTVITTPVVSNPANVVFTAFTSVTNAALTFTYADGPNHYYYVSVVRTLNGVDDPQGGIAQLPRAGVYRDPWPLFTADSSYAYKITPFNAAYASNPGGVVTTGPVSPDASAAVFQAFTTVNNTAMAFSYQTAGLCYYVSVTRVVNGTVTPVVTTQAAGATQYTDPSANVYVFTADTSYAYVLTPFNAVKTANAANASRTPPTSPDASAAVFQAFTTVSNTTMAFSYQTAGLCYYVSVARIVNGVVTPVVTTQAAGATLYTDPSTNVFTADNSYAYVLTPFNAIKAANAVNAVRTTVVSPDASAAVFQAFTTVNNSAVAFSYQTTGLCYYVSVTRIVNGTVTPVVTTQAAGATQYTDPSANVYVFTADTSYAYVLTPFNAVKAVNVANISRTPPTSPDASAAVFQAFSTVSNTTMAFSYQTAGLCYYVSVVRIVNGTVTPVVTTQAAGATQYTDPSTNVFTADNSYAYVLTPYNAIKAANATNAVRTTVVSPDASAAVFQAFTTVNNRAVAFSYQTAGLCYYVSVTRVVNGVATPVVTTQAAGATQYTDPSANVYVFTADTSYAYVLTPFNAVKAVNLANVSRTPPTSPDASAAVFQTFTTVSNTAMAFSYQTAGLCYYVSVTRIVNGTVTPVVTTQAAGATQYTDPSANVYVFTADTSYAYLLTPYNAVKAVNVANASRTVPVSPDASAAVFQAFTNVSNTAMVFSYLTTGLCYYVSVTRITNGVPILTTVQPPNTFQYTDPSNNIFTADSSYVYVLTPYNAVKAVNAANAIRTSVVSPFSTVNIGTISVSTTQISFPYVNTSSYYRVDVTRIYQNTTIDTTTFIQPVAYTDPSTNFTADSSYIYTLTSYNALNTLGTSFTTTALSPNASVTLGAIAATGSYLAFPITNISTAYYVSVARITNGVVGPYTDLAPGATSFTDRGSFTADTSYAYSIRPYNALYILGTVYTSVPASPPASVQIGPISTSITDISFAFINTTSFYQVAVARMMDGQIYDDYVLQPPGTVVYIDPSNVFSGSIKYSYSIIPYNILGIAGATLTTPQVNVGVVSASSAQFYDVIEITGLVSYYPFDFITEGASPIYTPIFASVIDTAELTMYYAFDF